ncbi:ATPase, partial [Candidatus Woesearchaeota archaeon CG10_big_fil_rev_8_21_14_0_10_34_8]
MKKGLVIRGDVSKIVVREKSNADIELGELLIVDSGRKKMLMQAYDLVYASQLSEQNIELISGLQLEQESMLEEDSITIMEPALRNYKLALLKGMLTIENNSARSCKSLPKFLSDVRDVTKEDLSFITTPKCPIYLGKLRSGSKILDVDIHLPGKQVFSHHILLAATTGKGKSNLMSVILWDATKHDYCGMLVLDPHDEYYGRNPNKITLKDHPLRPVYYTPKDPPVGAKTIKIHLSLIKPKHFTGVVLWSDAQYQALHAYYKEFGDKWIENIVMN